MSELVKKAEKYAKNLDYGSAYKLLVEADAKGDPIASYALGTWYLFGRYVDKDYKKAVSYLNKASKKGSKDALFNLAVCYEVGAGVDKNPVKAFHNYYEAFKHGDIGSAYEIGRCLYYGIGVTKNTELADYFLNLANQNGYSYPSNRKARKPSSRPSLAIAAG
jgi:TPR repeat protein